MFTTSSDDIRYQQRYRPAARSPAHHAQPLLFISRQPTKRCPLRRGCRRAPSPANTAAAAQPSSAAAHSAAHTRAPGPCSGAPQSAGADLKLDQAKFSAVWNRPPPDSSSCSSSCSSGRPVTLRMRARTVRSCSCSKRLRRPGEARSGAAITAAREGDLREAPRSLLLHLSRDFAATPHESTNPPSVWGGGSEARRECAHARGGKVG